MRTDRVRACAQPRPATLFHAFEEGAAGGRSNALCGQARRSANLAVTAEVAPVCLDAFEYAGRTVGASVPRPVREQLAVVTSDSPASRYLLQSGRGRRLVSNLLASGGLRAGLAFGKSQLFPSADILRVHHPHLSHLPRGLLLLHRWMQFSLPKWRGR